MTKDNWKNTIKFIVKTDDESRLDLLASILEESEKAHDLLTKKGYIGKGLFNAVKQVPNKEDKQ